jgi:alpha/beta superfamily hydrolase
VGRWVAWPGVLVAASLALAACGAPHPVAADHPVAAARPSSPAPLPAFYALPDPVTPAPPGALVRHQSVVVPPGLPRGSHVVRVLYHSSSDTGTDVVVSGVVVVPPGPPPTGGFPIVTWAHPTTGLPPACLPSLGGATPIPYLGALVRAGDVVAATDYQGLGPGAIEPYLVGQSEARDVLDAARAARELLGAAASNTVVVAGYSEGAQAALVAGQVAERYAPDLFVRGVVAIAPPASVDELVPHPPGPKPDAGLVYAVMALVAWAADNPGTSLGTTVLPDARGRAAALEHECVAAAAAAFAHLAPDAVLRRGWEATPAARAVEAASVVGGSPTLAPVLVVQGTADTIVPPSGTATLVRSQLCRAEHDTVTYDRVPAAGHGSVVAAASAEVVSWIGARLHGAMRTAGRCGAPPSR